MWVVGSLVVFFYPIGTNTPTTFWNVQTLPELSPQDLEGSRGFVYLMASPQAENGHTKIANEILEQLVKTGLLGSEWNIVIWVIRKTYGYQKKEDWISLTQFEKATNLSRPTVVKTLKNLVNRGLLVKRDKLGYSFEKDYEKWVVNTAKLVKHNDPGSKDRLTEIGKHGLTHKRNKENTKEINPVGEEINQIFSIFEKTINPTINYGNTTQRNAIETLISKIGFDKTAGAAKYAISIQTDRYAPTITTPIQLLNKYGELRGYYAKRNTKQTNQKKGIIL